jgi:sugar/nucleoside kinase (ribokinase family)
LIVGTVAFDAIETPFGKTDKILGGAGTFIGLAASQFDIDTAVVSVVGGDFPPKYLDLLIKQKHRYFWYRNCKEWKNLFLEWQISQ